MANTTFVSFRQFCAENGSTGLNTLKEPLYKKTHADGTTENVPGIQLTGKNTVLLALSKALAGKSTKELAGQAANLQVAVQKFNDATGSERTGYILCSNAREVNNDFCALSF